MNATIYIRPADEAAWRAIENKSEFIHQALNGTPRSAEKKESPVKELLKIPGIKRASQVSYKTTQNWGA